MGQYNPHAPQILGQEWVPIREPALTLTPAVNLVEVGHGFTNTANQTITTARFYVRNWPAGSPSGQVVLASLYRRDTEELTGPVRSVVVPCSLGTATGSVTIVGATTIAQAMSNPSDFSYVEVPAGSAPFIQFRFETESYMPMLIGKRILGIDFLYASILDQGSDPPVTISISIGSTGSTGIGLGTLPGTNDNFTGINTQLGRIKVGEVDYHWNAPTTSIIEVLPWSPNRLRAFDDSSGLTNRFIMVNVDSAPTVNQVVIFDYCALEIFFCEEQRVLWGGRRFTGSSGSYLLGANQITMRDLTDAATPVLTPGDYDLLVSSANLTPGNAVAYPELNQIQQLYEIPPHPAIRTIRPFPMDPTALGKTFENEETFLLPQISLHTSTGPITDVHVYGRQAAAQVYGSITATQEILDSAAGNSYQYPWVRYFARRFGDTSVPLTLTSPTITGSSVDITPEEFDELDEIVDGWKEVTLRFDTPPTMGSGTNPQWRWSATGEVAGSRWEVLGTYAPALSGAPGNLFNQVPSPHQLSVATYGMPVSGANINLGWVPQYAPPVSATVDDQTADASLIFAQDLPMITGFSVTEVDQTLTGIGLDCGVDPCCIPTEIQYHEITWPSDYVAAEEAGLVVPTGANYASTPDAASLDITSDIDIWVDVTMDNWVTGTEQTLIAKYQPVGDQRSWRFYIGVTGDLRLATSSTGTGASTGVSTANPDPPDSGRLGLRVTFDANNGAGGRTFTFYTSQEGLPGTWVQLGDPVIVGSTTSIFNSTAAVEVGAYGGGISEGAGTYHSAGVANGIGGTVVTNPMFEDQPTGTTSFTDDYGRVWTVQGSASIQGDGLGYFELQRMDTVDNEWQTIMAATSPGTTGFNDYEARPGILSSYRIRAVDVYDFPGPWSATVSNTLPAPGVTIGCEGGHLLIFTSNEAQDGSLNLAYSSVWEDAVEESFAFPEARFVELQAMYNRDFFVAFRPTERGGEQFSRTILIQAAAISPETLADFTSLRDMAWADVSYICVRDEDGNRWFSTVLVPAGRVLRDRRLYLAPVDIIEVTDTPSQVNP